MINDVFISGCGDIGERVARLWQARGVTVNGMARSPASRARLEAKGISAVPGDLDDTRSLATDRARAPYSSCAAVPNRSWTTLERRSACRSNRATSTSCTERWTTRQANIEPVARSRRTSKDSTRLRLRRGMGLNDGGTRAIRSRYRHKATFNVPHPRRADAAPTSPPRCPPPAGAGVRATAGPAPRLMCVGRDRYLPGPTSAPPPAPPAGPPPG